MICKYKPKKNRIGAIIPITQVRDGEFFQYRYEDTGTFSIAKRKRVGNDRFSVREGTGKLGAFPSRNFWPLKENHPFFHRYVRIVG